MYKFISEEAQILVFSSECGFMKVDGGQIEKRSGWNWETPSNVFVEGATPFAA